MLCGLYKMSRIKEKKRRDLQKSKTLTNTKISLNSPEPSNSNHKFHFPRVYKMQNNKKDEANILYIRKILMKRIETNNINNFETSKIQEVFVKLVDLGNIREK
jgi:hypothetical protein